MGGWSVYCAICAGPFSSQLDVDPEETAQDECCYRDKVLRDCKLEWLDEVCGMGINPDSPRDDKSFLSGVGFYWDCGSICVAPGGDPNEPLYGDDDQISLTAYHDLSDSDLPHVFPFHPICYYGILQRCIHQENMGKLNQKVLIDVMEEASDESHIRLDLSYGEPEPPAEQYWFSVKGQEVLVVNPVEIPQLKAELDDIMESIHKMAAPDQRSRSPDIFDRLPVELRNWVFEFLPAGSIVALKAASLAMHSTTLSGEFWKRRLRTELPWLWEIHDIDIFQSQEVEERASKLLLNIEKKSLYTSESDDYIFGLANRRRIWGVCEQLRSRYLQKLEGIANT